MSNAAGQLKHRMSFYSSVQTATESGDPAESFNLLATRRAGIKALSSSETVVSGGTQAKKSHEITARYLAGILHSTRIEWNDRVFNVVSVLNPEESNDWLIFTTSEDE